MNKISRLKKPDDTTTDDANELGRMIKRFYKDIYRLEGTQNMAVDLGTVPIIVTPSMNDNLLKPFAEKEVKEALF
jgi:hypothetical protein